MKKHTFTPSNILLAVTLMLFIISFSVIIVLNFRPLYYNDIDQLNITKISGLTKEKIKANYDALIDYNSLFNHDDLEFPDLPMSESGQIHFEEVKDIFVAVEYLCIFTAVLALIGTFFKRYSGDFRFLKLTAVFTIIIPLILGILIALNWDTFFVTFHQIFFNNDYWIFDASTDPVILLLPDAFFMHCALAILVLVILGSILSYTAHRLLLRRTYITGSSGQ